MATAAARTMEPPCEITLENLFHTPEGRRVLTCLQCGACVATCPYGEQMDYPPRRMTALLRAGLVEKVFTNDSLLACVACYACKAKCPRQIDLTGVLLPLAKERVLARHPELPVELQKALENKLRYGIPMGESPRKRAAWTATAGVPIRQLPTDPRPVDVLWFVECYCSFYPPGRGTAPRPARPPRPRGRWTCWGSSSVPPPSPRAGRTTPAPPPGSCTPWEWTSPSWATRRSAPGSAAGSPGSRACSTP